MMPIIVRMSTPNKKNFMLLAILISLTGALGSTALGEGGPIATTRCKEAERHALLEIKENLHELDVGFLSSWGNGDERRECCEWIGIRCDNKSGHVIRLDLSPSTLGRDQNHFFEGNLSSSLVDLHYLQYLDLSYIDFYRNSIPSFIGSLSKLRYLNLSHTTMSGKVPPQLGNLSSLQFLDLSETYLKIKNMEWASHLSSLQLLDLSSTHTSLAHDWVHVVNNLPHLKILKLRDSQLPDTVPLSLSFVNSSKVLAIIDLYSSYGLSSSIFQWLFNYSHSLVHLDLSFCFLNGSIPEAFENMAVLEYLDLSWNELEGSIPQSFGNMTALEYLDLSDSGLDGSIPQSFGKMTALEYLDLSSNGLNGSIPQSFGNMIALQYLDLSSNGLNGSIPQSFGNMIALQYLDLSSNGLNGSIPQSFGNMIALEYLDLSSNGLNGSIPRSFGNMTALGYLDLSHNGLDGSIPQSFGNMTALSHLYLFHNGLDGSIPQSFGNMTALEYLYLFQNELDGFIPQSFGKMTALEYLDLSQNGLDGSIPQSFGNMTALECLDLSHNGLDGSIPQSFGNMTALEYLDLSHNGLDGSIPQSFGNMTALEYLDLSSNKLEGEIPKSIWRVCTLRKLRADDNSLAGELHLAESSTRCAIFPLEELDLGNNQIMGSLPNFTLYPSLITLSLGSNKLDGNVSKSIWQLSKLKVLDISENFVADVISEAHFSKLINLWVLDLSSNSKIVFEISPDWIPPFQLGEISLRSVNLGRHFPNWLQTQTSYSGLDISYSGIAESIPNWFWTSLSTHIREVSLNLSNNGISTLAHDSEGIDDLHAVGVKIDLSSNQLEGSIPLFLLQVATSLYLVDNKFSGLNSICNATQSLPLGYLDVSNNKLSGELPDCWSYAEGLVILNLKNNSLTGKIPISIGFLTRMLILRLSNNHLIGNLPSSLKNCTLLSVLDIGENKLSGQIPAWIGKSTRLIVLSIRSNNFYGSIPSQLCHLQGLQLLDLSSNWLSSGIPTCLGNITAMKEIGSNPQFVSGGIWEHKISLYNRSDKYDRSDRSDISDIYDRYDRSDRYERIWYLPIPPIENDKLRLVWKGVVSEFKNAGLLRNIDLSSNKLIGVIPNEVTELVALVSLNLSRNNLSGEIPQKIGELKSLDALDLSKNHLSGVIPSSLSQISGLSTLDLSNNSLSGKIPTGTQLQTRDAAAYFGNSELCGEPLPKKCPGEDEPTTSGATDDHGDDQDDEDQLITKGFYISSAVGFIVAFWGFCLALIFNKSWRYRYLKSLNKAEDWVYVTVAVNKAKLLRIIKN